MPPTASELPGRGSDPRRADPHARAFGRRIDCAEREGLRAAAPPARGGPVREPDRRAPRPRPA
jgi:hypothetical protein